jgi:riboflavin synthase
MFTGLIEGIGTVTRVTPGSVTDIWIEAPFVSADFRRGESIACDGVCLTALQCQGAQFLVQAAPETLRRSTAATWRNGTRINCEKAMKVGSRLGGHWVQGHVDAMVELLSARDDGGAWLMRMALPSRLAPYFIDKGSVCLDGVSLTVNEVLSDSFSVMLIPETAAQTTLLSKRPGQQLNVEADVLGKYVAKMLGPRAPLSLEQLERAGY